MSTITVVNDPPPTDKTWQQWREMVENLGWYSDDHCVVEITPSLKNTRAVVATDENSDYLGSVVWYEHDDLAFMGFYIMDENLRGKGIGTQIWKKAMDRIAESKKPLGLRGVSSMEQKYMANGLPYKAAVCSQVIATWQQMTDICKSKPNRQKRTVRDVKDLTEEEFEQYLAFDKEVTRRDRSYLLQEVCKHPSMSGSVLFDENEEIVATGSLTRTSLPENHMFKLGPIYASTLADSLQVIGILMELARKIDPKAVVVFHMINGTRGEKELRPLLERRNILVKETGASLFSEQWKNPIDNDKLYIVNNNPCHFDA